MLKLLSPQEAKDASGQEIARSLLRVEEALKIEKEWRLKLAKAETDFNEMLAKHRKEWEREYQEHIAHKKELTKEIDYLEAKKINALIPIGVLKEGADERVEDAVSILAKLELREEYVEEMTEKLQNKLDETGEREQDLKKQEDKLATERNGMELQRKEVAEGAIKLAKQSEEFMLKRQQEEKEIDERKTALFLLDRKLNSRNDELKRREKGLEEWALRLQDERKTLEMAFAEMRRMKQSLSP